MPTHNTHIHKQQLAEEILIVPIHTKMCDYFCALENADSPHPRIVHLLAQKMEHSP